MCGWLSDDAVCASRWNRRRAARVGQVVREKLDGDGAVELGVERAVDHAHAALADQLEDFIRAESRTCGQ